MIFVWSLILIIVLHELAHFLAAKACKCGVPEVAFGFGWTLWQKQFGKTLYKINVIPLGGYCKLQGELDYSRSKYAFTNKTYSQKVFISLAGIIVNVVTGVAAYLIGQHYLNLTVFAFGFYSIWMGISNLIPFPCLDGSYPFFFLLEKKLGKKKTYALMQKVFASWFKWLMILNILCMPYLVYLIMKGKIL